MKTVYTLAKQYFSAEFIRFLVAGGIAAVVNFCSRIVINKFVVFEIAVIIAYIIGMITAFILNRKLVFNKGRYHWVKQFYLFTLVNIVAILQTFVISVLLYRYLFPCAHFSWHAGEIAHGVGVIFPVFTSYLGHKYYSFKPASGEK